MTNLENLTEKIISDAKQQAEQIMEAAHKKQDKLINDKSAKALMEKEVIIKKAKTEAALMKDRVISRAKLKTRDEKLLAKQEVLDQVFSLAKEKLARLSEEQYVNFLHNQLKDIKLKGSEVLIVPEDYLKTVQGLGLDIPVSEEEFVDTGFLLKDNQVILNYSFDSLIDFYRDELESIIARDLFKDEG